jgi:DNA-binding NarL/FixJ family response regulator
MPAPRPLVVIVDDHAGFRSAARGLFEARGYDVVAEADSGAALWAVLERCVPDLVVLDIGLGAENGFDVARVLTHAHPSVAVLLVSASDHYAGLERIQASGARGFVGKSDLMRVDLEAIWRHSHAWFPDSTATAAPLRCGTPGFSA